MKKWFIWLSSQKYDVNTNVSNKDFLKGNRIYFLQKMFFRKEKKYWNIKADKKAWGKFVNISILGYKVLQTCFPSWYLTADWSKINFYNLLNQSKSVLCSPVKICDETILVVSLMGINKWKFHARDFMLRNEVTMLACSTQGLKLLHVTVTFYFLKLITLDHMLRQTD